jgi:hypothetical protein
LQLITHSLPSQAEPEAFGSVVVQTLPQPPQLFGSLVVSEHALSQHVDVLSPHADPHAPQLFGSLVVSMHAPPQHDSAIPAFVASFPPVAAAPVSHERPTLSHTPAEVHICGC